MIHVHFEQGEAHPMSDALEDTLIAEEEHDTEDYWAELAECYANHEESALAPAVTGTNAVSKSFNF